LTFFIGLFQPSKHQEHQFSLPTGHGVLLQRPCRDEMETKQCFF
jgi:hypothetical protein